MNTELHVIGPLGLFRRLLERSGIAFTEYPAFSDIDEECLVPNINVRPPADFESFLGAAYELATRYMALMNPCPRKDGRFLATVYSSICFEGETFPDFGSREESLRILTSAQEKICLASGCLIVLPAEDAPLPMFNPIYLSTFMKIRPLRAEDKKYILEGPPRRSLVDDILNYAVRPQRQSPDNTPVYSLTPVLKDTLRYAGFPAYA